VLPFGFGLVKLAKKIETKMRDYPSVPNVFRVASTHSINSENPYNNVRPANANCNTIERQPLAIHQLTTSASIEHSHPSQQQQQQQQQHGLASGVAGAPDPQSGTSNITTVHGGYLWLLTPVAARLVWDHNTIYGDILKNIFEKKCSI